MADVAGIPQRQQDAANGDNPNVIVNQPLNRNRNQVSYIFHLNKELCIHFFFLFVFTFLILFYRILLLMYEIVFFMHYSSRLL